MTDSAVALPTDRELSVNEMDAFLISGDLARLTEGQRVNYYMQMCKRAGVDPVMKPFDYLQLQGKLVLYCNRNGGDQIAAANIVSRKIVSRELNEAAGLITVTAEASLPNGRIEQSTGVVSIKFANGGTKHGDDLANAWMKAETKAKRRAVLAVTGLSLLDESELESIPGRTMEQAHTAHQLTIEAAVSQPDDEEPQLLYDMVYGELYDPDVSYEVREQAMHDFADANNIDNPYDLCELLQDQLTSHIRNRAQNLNELEQLWKEMTDNQKDCHRVRAAVNTVKVQLSVKGKPDR